MGLIIGVKSYIDAVFSYNTSVTDRQTDDNHDKSSTDT